MSRFGDSHGSWIFTVKTGAIAQTAHQSGCPANEASNHDYPICTMGLRARRVAECVNDSETTFAVC